MVGAVAVVPGSSWVSGARAAGVSVGNSVVVVADNGLASVLVSLPTQGAGNVAPEEQAMSRTAMMQMMAKVILTIRSPRASRFVLRGAGSTEGFRANGGNCPMRPSHRQ